MFPCNKNKQPVVAGWKTYTGVCDSLVYGLPVPAGYVVMDLDTYKNNNLKKQISEFLGVDLDWENAFLQFTQNGGEHYAFETSEVIRQGSNIRDNNGNKIEGFDIRTAGSGYICSGEGYSENLTADDFFMRPTLPTGLAIIKGPVDLNTNKKVHNLGDFEGLLEPSESLENIQELLTSCDNDCGNEEWVKIGMAVHSEYPGDDGLALWENWSKGGETYREGECAKRWVSFKQNGDVKLGSLYYYSGLANKKKQVTEYVINEEFSKRLILEFERGAEGVSFVANMTNIKMMLKNTYYTCASKTFFKMFNTLGQVIRVDKADIATVLIDNFGSPIENYHELLAAVEANEQLTISNKKQALSKPVNIIVKLLKEFHQRERVTQQVDMFSPSSHMSIHSKEVVESLKYEPMVIEHEMYDDEIVTAYEKHFPELYEVLDMIIASRFASSRKKCYLWINASSDWGKDLFRVCLGERAVEMSVTQIGKAIKGETVSIHFDDIVGTFALCVNEFSHVNSELKQIENSIVVAPKYLNQAVIPTFAKLFFSADDVDSLVGEYGVESQFNNRFSLLAYEGAINALPVFRKVGQYTFTHTLKTHVANYINGSVEKYIEKGKHISSIDADLIVTSFHKKYCIGNQVGDFKDNLESISATVAKVIQTSEDIGFNTIHEDEIVYMRPKTLIQGILFKLAGKSEITKLSHKWRAIVDLISEEGIKSYKIEGKAIKGFKLTAGRKHELGDDI